MKRGKSNRFSSIKQYILQKTFLAEFTYHDHTLGIIIYLH